MKGSTIIIAILLVVIAILAWLLIAKQAEAPTVPNATTTSSTISTSTNNADSGSSGSATAASKPLHDRIVVTFPKSGANVPKKFTVLGRAPGNWFFEASAPAMVQAPDGSKIAQGLMQAQGEWMTTNLVDFKADISINPAYSGPATLVLLKDNPSGLPENDDSLEIPIVVQ